MDVQRGDVRPLAGFDQGRNTNPEFSADGRSLYFVATPDGIPNIYRASIAPVRPAGHGGDADHERDVGRQRDHAAHAGAFGGRRRAADGVHGLRGGPLQHLRDDDDARRRRAGSVADRDAAVLPPFNRRTGDVAELLASPLEGLPAADCVPAEGIHGHAVARPGRPAHGRRRRGSLRRLCGRRTVVPLERHARESRAGHHGAADQPPPGDWRRPSPTSIARRAGTGASSASRRRT